MKKIKQISICFLIFFSIILLTNVAYAGTELEVYQSTITESEKGNVTYAEDITNEMASASYWANKLGQEADKLILNHNEIKTINQEIVDGSGTQVFDITTITESKTQAVRKASVANSIQSDFDYMVRNYPNKDRKLYVDGALIDNLPYIENLKNAVLTTGFENDNEKVQLYAVGTNRTEVKMFPTKSIWGYDSPNDPDDESCNSTIEVNEPFVIRAKCTIGEDTFYWGLTKNCTGWVNGEYLALFDSKEEWIDAWKVDVDGNNFLVVTQDSIALESSTNSNEIQLKLGTILKLVPENEIPESVNNRTPWNNYVVYLPTRNEEGKYVRGYALIAEHYNVNIGFLPLTQRNILDVAFTCLGNRYGWGGMLGSMDCSAYTKAIYKCFGLELPRNTTNQQKVPNRTVSLADMSDTEKESYIEKLPVGTLLFFPGHVTMYIGSENGKNYVISDTGSLSDSYGDVNVRSMYSVIINPLTVRRRNGSTWLTNVSNSLIFGEIPGQEPSGEDIYVTVDEESNKGNLTYDSDISMSMSKPSYWKNLLNEKDRQLLTKEEIKKLNKRITGKDSKDLNSKAVLVVTQNRIILEPSISEPETSEVELPLGTVLELVPEDKIPTNIGERGPWNNYVVYLPINGKIKKKYALIPEHCNVSIGYLSMTQENIIKVAFSCLGDSYSLMNNASFISSVYKCFGLEISTNSELSIQLKNKLKDLSKISLDEKKQILKDTPVGSILQIEDKYAIYLGNQDNNYYIIFSTGENINSIILTKAELENLTSVIDFTLQPVFPDVELGEWYTDGIRFCKDNGLMSGYGSGPKAGCFGPNDNITRGQIVTILWRQENKPEVDYDMNFSDIKNPDEWYYKAIKWAAKNGIATGYQAGPNAGKFLPDTNITREQLALILQRYAAYCGRDSETQGDISGFPDANKVSDWALVGIRWAVGVKIISGKGDGRIDPQGTATRAEAATMIMRFCENILDV